MHVFKKGLRICRDSRKGIFLHCCNTSSSIWICQMSEKKIEVHRNNRNTVLRNLKLTLDSEYILSNLFRLSPNVHQMFTKCSHDHTIKSFLAYHPMFNKCSYYQIFLSYHPMFTMHCCFGPGLVYLYYT